MTNQELFELLARFESSSLTSLKLSDGAFSLELSRGGAPAPFPSAAAVPVFSPAAAPAVPVPSAPAEGQTVTAPLVGTYYAAPSPDEAPFVSAGDRVSKGQTLCLIEAMKMLSEVPAPCDCVITDVLKENGALVSFGEPLFRYRPC